jgi:hypothetical protein
VPEAVAGIIRARKPNDAHRHDRGDDERDNTRNPARVALELLTRK